MGKMSKIEAEIRQLYEEEGFPDIIRNEGLREVSNGFEKRVEEINGEIKDVDLRMANKVRYRLCDILFIAFAAMICQVKSYSHMAVFAEMEEEWLRQYTRLPEGRTPSRDTFRRVLSMLRPEFLKSTFQAVISRLLRESDPSMDTSHVAMDGKSVTGYYTHSGNKILHSVSLWCSRLGLSMAVAATKKTGKKEVGEIEVAKELLKVFDLKRKVLTADAGFCYKIIAEAVVAAGGDWIFALKGNQKNAYCAAKEMFPDDKSEDSHTTFNHGHGRDEIRTYQTRKIPEKFTGEKGWKNVRSFVKVTSTRKIKDKTSVTIRYYITSLPPENRLAIADYIRSHWSIENNLHWRLDLVYREDAERSRTGYGPENLLIFRRAALSALNTYGRVMHLDHVPLRAFLSRKLSSKIIETFLNITEKRIE
ncbi:MAG: ISAs1 family transposase [Planctomycetia bacterium]|nr:ISAs1 family transposase [Planctomycetia bacterium]